MMTARLIGAAALVALAGGCADAIGRFQDLPQTDRAGTAPWPRLIDVPAPPETALTPERARERRAALAEEARALRAAAPTTEAGLSGDLRRRAAAPPPDPEALRVTIDGAALTARARAAQSEAVAAPQVDSADLEARARLARSRAEAERATTVRTRPAAPRPAPVDPERIAAPVLSDDFREKARRALRRAGRL